MSASVSCVKDASVNNRPIRTAEWAVSSAAHEYRQMFMGARLAGGVEEAGLEGGDGAGLGFGVGAGLRFGVEPGWRSGWIQQ